MFSRIIELLHIGLNKKLASGAGGHPKRDVAAARGLI